MTDSDLAAGARAVLDDNWLGGATKPAPRLYPHQWSWDSAFIAIGNRHERWDRAAAELETLFAAQWANGMVPHIVFSVVAEAYFPSAGFWDSARSSLAPSHAGTTGIVQPAVHAIAALMVSEARPDEHAFLARLFPKLVAWHDYLIQERADETGWREIWHPWESGMDNSPLWDDPLARMDFGPEDVPEYKRVDNQIADAADRPTDRQYDEYAFLVGRLRAEDYSPADMTALPFRVQDVLFNSAFVAGSRALAEMARLLGVDAAPIEAQADRIEAAIDDHLWDEDLGLYLNRDARTGELVRVRSCSGLAPLIHESARRERLLETFDAMVAPIGNGGLIPSVPVGDPGFDSKKYWRGPAWIQINWLLRRGLLAAGERERADVLRHGMLGAVEACGFWEYFDVTDTSGHGSDHFSWTAALVLDLLAES